MGSHSIDKVKDKQCDVKRNIDTKKSELSQLEQRKQSLMDSGTEVQNSNMDDEIKKQVMELINGELEMNSDKGKELSSEMQDDLQSLTEMKIEVKEMLEDTKDNRQKLEQEKSVLDKFGLGKNIDSAISDMSSSENQLNELGDSLLGTEEELNETSHRLNML